VRRPALLLVAGLAVAACGADTPPPRPPTVQLYLDAPADGARVDARKLEIRGRVSPAGAQVRVLGQAAETAGGRFSAEVALSEGANVVDVSATAPDRSPALAALRVTLDTRIAVPDVTGLRSAEAASKLDALGLRFRERRTDSFFDRLLPAREVCMTDPQAGARVPRGSEVVLDVARDCA
jgi:hypothetical protein